jgi:hypothetical protein
VLHFQSTPDRGTAGEGPTITSSPAPASGVRAFASLTGLTSLGILVEAVIAGQFIGKKHEHTLISTHGMIANVIILLSLITVILAWRLDRQTRGPLLVGSGVLFVLVVVQTILGHLISDGHHTALTVVHVPVALLVFGLTIWLSLQAAVISRAARLG